MQPWIQRERLLPYIIEMVRRPERIEDQVPAVTGYRRGDQDEKVLPEKPVTEASLTRPVGTGHQPVRIRHVIGVEDVNLVRVDHAPRGQNVTERVNDFETAASGL